MDFRYGPAVRAISLIVLFFFCWTFAGGLDIAYAVKNKDELRVASVKSKNLQNSGSNNNPPRPEEKFQKAIEDLDQALSDTSTDTETKKTKVKAKQSDIQALDVDIRKQFAATEKKLKDEGLPSEILDRHYKFVKHYENNLKELKNELDDIGKAKTKTDAEAAIGRTKAHLEKAKPPKKHKPLDPNKLPHRTMEPVFIEPRTAPEQFTEGVVKQAKGQQKPILVASNGSLNGLLSAANEPILLAALTPPTSADLAETIEVQLTPAIQAKAAELNHNPTKIYNWVRNNIEYVPTYGSIQGADMCLQTKQCNDFDTASLLIALLRASGIHARYVYGTIELPIEKVKNWLGGFTNSMEALRLIASAKIPVKGMTEGGEIRYARMEHVWVEAWIDYIPSRGEIHRHGDTWIPLDASFKQNDYSNMGVNLFGTLPFDYNGFYDSLKASATIDPDAGSVTSVDTNLGESLIAGYIEQGESYISTNYPDATDEILFGERVIIDQNFTFLLGTLPYRVIARGAVFSEIPANLQHRVHFSVIKDVTDDITGTPISHSIAMPAVAGKRISLGYKPATASDVSVLKSLFPKPHADGSPLQLSEMPQSLPSYLLQLTPTLWIDGKVVATGTAIGMGQSESFTVTLSRPNGTSESIVNEAISGEYYGIYIDTGFLDHDYIVEKVLDHYSHLTAAIEKTVVPTADSIFGELLNNLAAAYFSQLAFFEIDAAKVNGIINYRLPSFGMVQAVLNVQYAFGIPFSASPGGIMMDIDHYISITGATDGDREKVKNFNLVTGTYGSALEHSIPEQFFSLPEAPAEGISAVKLIGLANSQNIPVYTITKANIAAILPLLHVDPAVLTDIQNAINAGKEVIVPERNLAVANWSGIGYLVLDPTTGNGGYIISGGKNGGFMFALGTYWIQIGGQAMEAWPDDPLFGTGIIQDGINTIIQAQTLWAQVLKTAGGTAVDLALNFLPWGKVAGVANSAAMPLIANITKSKWVYNFAKGRRLEKVVLENLLGDWRLAEKKLFLTTKGATIPDHFVRDAMDVNKITELWEIKNWTSLGVKDGNIPKLLQLSKKQGCPLNVVVGHKTKVERELISAVCETGGLVFSYSAVTKIFEDIPCE